MKTTSFDIETLVPSVVWQNEKMRLLRDGDPVRQSVVAVEICTAFNSYDSIKTDDVAPPESAELSEVMHSIREVLFRSYSPRERLVFFLLFPNLPLAANEVGTVITRTDKVVDATTLDVRGIDGRLARIADILGITRERVRQIRGETLVKIQTRLHHHFPK
jgi:DNA-directed RNA polymerase sigma subunit (sigma70/sigma32)